MATRKTKSVDEAIDEVVEDKKAAEAKAEVDSKKTTEEADPQEADNVKEVESSLAKAQTAIDSARNVLNDAYGKARVRSHEAAERSKVYLEDARSYLADARESMGRLATRTREQMEELYSKTKDQYEALAGKTRDLFGKVKDRMAEVDFKNKGDQVLDYIKTNPGKAVIIALAAGFFVGYATRPRD